jgi:zinc transport system ATP-binding protein
LVQETCIHGHVLSGPPVCVTGVGFRYPGGKTVLADVSFELGPRSHTCMIGPNGGGKTTLLRLLLGLLTPTEGTMEVLGAPPHRACSHVGYVPQHTDVRRGFPITVREVVLTGCIGDDPFRRHRVCVHRAEEIMEELAIVDLRNRSFDKLSGGQRQRVLIARALVGDPSLLLLDEPTANVDPGVAHLVRKLLDGLADRIGILTVSHDLEYIDSSLDQVLFVNGTVKALAPSEVTAELVWGLFGRPREAS